MAVSYNEFDGQILSLPDLIFVWDLFFTQVTTRLEYESKSTVYIFIFIFF